MSENPIPSKSLSSDGSDESKLIDGSTDFAHLPLRNFKLFRLLFLYGKKKADDTPCKVELTAQCLYISYELNCTGRR